MISDWVKPFSKINSQGSGKVWKDYKTTFEFNYLFDASI